MVGQFVMVGILLIVLRVTLYGHSMHGSFDGDRVGVVDGVFVGIVLGSFVGFVVGDDEGVLVVHSVDVQTKIAPLNPQPVPTPAPFSISSFVQSLSPFASHNVNASRKVPFTQPG